jgi:hypothetical protein
MTMEALMFAALDLIAGFVQLVLLLSMGLILVGQTLARRHRTRVDAARGGRRGVL